MVTIGWQVVGGDPDKDVAVLQLLDISPDKMRELKPVQLGISSTLMVGQRCAFCCRVHIGMSTSAAVMSAGWSRPVALCPPILLHHVFLSTAYSLRSLWPNCGSADIHRRHPAEACTCAMQLDAIKTMQHWPALMRLLNRSLCWIAGCTPSATPSGWTTR